MEQLKKQGVLHTKLTVNQCVERLSDEIERVRKITKWYQHLDLWGEVKINKFCIYKYAGTRSDVKICGKFIELGNGTQIEYIIKGAWFYFLFCLLITIILLFATVFSIVSFISGYDKYVFQDVGFVLILGTIAFGAMCFYVKIRSISAEKELFDICKRIFMA